MSAPGLCVLHDAITAANTMTATNGCAAGTGSDTINFRVTGTISLGNTLPKITDSLLAINSPSSRGITIDGSGQVQVMQVASGAKHNLNKLTIANGFNNYGGGIYNYYDGTLTATNSTFVRNRAAAGGGISNHNPVGVIIIKSTILVASSRGNCFGTITDAGYNIFDDSACGFSATGSLNDTDPMLDPNGLQNNGGPTQTVALLSGSRAIDAIPLTDCTDQVSPPNPLITD